MFSNLFDLSKLIIMTNGLQEMPSNRTCNTRPRFISNMFKSIIRLYPKEDGTWISDIILNASKLVIAAAMSTATGALNYAVIVSIYIRTDKIDKYFAGISNNANVNAELNPTDVYANYKSKLNLPSNIML